MDEPDEQTKMLQHSIDIEVARIEKTFDTLWDRQAPLIALGQGFQAALSTKNRDSHRKTVQYFWLTEEAKANIRQELAEEALEIANLGIDFKIILEEIHSNPMVKAQWEKMLVLMKLVEKPK